MINFGAVPAGSVLPIPFTTYGKTNGESITLTGLAVTDIEVYKGTSMTQRASDAGYALMDTDGIDIDSVTGFHGFSIDLGDNTDAGFYAAGSFYTVLVSSITVDGQTVNFIAATFRIVAAEGVAGVPDVNVTHVGDTAQTAGDVTAKINTIDDFLDTEIAAILEDTGTTLDDFVDDLEGRLTAALATQLAAHSLGVGRGVVDASSTTTAMIMKSVNGAAASAVNDFYNGRHVVFTSGDLMLQAVEITDYVGATKTATISAATAAPAEDVTFVIV